MSDGLKSYNVTVDGRRTSMRLEPRMWQALNEIARLEGCTVHELCAEVDRSRGPNTGLTTAVRAFIVTYLWHMAHDSGSDLGPAPEPLDPTGLRRPALQG